MKTDDLVYNSSNQLVSKTVTNSSGDTTDTYTYTYDSKGNCTGYTKNASSASPENITFLYDGFNQFVGKKTNDVQNFTYTYDVLGKRITKTTAYGNAVDLFETDLTVSNPCRYGSYYYDEESGFYYLNARYYDSENGRFTQRDTYIGKINAPSTLNLYAYAAGNPIYYTDPTGHWLDTFLDIVSFGYSLKGHSYSK